MSGLLKLMSSMKGGIDPGLLYLQQSAKAAWDYTNLSGLELDTIGSNVLDISPNGVDFVPSGGTPKVWFTNAGLDGVTCYCPPGFTNTYALNNTLELSAAQVQALFNSDFEIVICMHMNEGSIGAGLQPIFVISNTSNNHNIQVYHNGVQFIFIYRTGGTQVSTAPSIFAAGPVGLTVFRIRLDFTTDAGKLYRNGIDTGAVFTGMTANPAGFAPGLKMHLGAYNLNGAISGAGLSTRNHSHLMMAITPLMSDTDAMNVQNYMFNRWNRTY